ncbi:MAG: glycosyltransferase family 2 protein, partial [Thermoplasmata archaeon]
MFSGGAMLVELEIFLILLLSFVVLAFHGWVLWLASRMPSIPGGMQLAPSMGVRVSAIVPARNEEEDLGPCLDGLLAQEHELAEILVVDGNSEDRTRDVALARAPRVRLLEEPPLPEGWVGKNWACHIGAAAASGEYLLFTDSDVRSQSHAVGTALAWAEAQQADLVTLAPRIETVGFWERVVLPLFTQFVLTYFRVPAVNRDSSSAAAALGPFMLFRRSAYARVGGHAAVRGVVLEDVALARLLRRAGLRLRIGWAPELLATRMYRDRAEMSEGILKNLHGLRFSAWRQVGFLVALVGLFWLPLLVLPLGLGSG